MLTMTSGLPDDTWSGRIGDGGEVVWTNPNGYPFRTRIEGGEVVMEGVKLKDGVVVKAKSASRFRGHLPESVSAGATGAALVP